MPAQHQQHGLGLVQQVFPRDSLGQADPNGRIVMLSIGMSNANRWAISYTCGLQSCFGSSELDWVGKPKPIPPKGCVGARLAGG
jgi:hypothetical protein